MAIPTLTTDMTVIDDADANAGWSGWGQNASKWDDEVDIYLEGAGSQGLQPFYTGDGGYGYDLVAATFDATANLILIWVYTTPGFIDTSANYGVYVRITSDSAWTTNYLDYKVGGSDVAWVGKGWHLIVLDANRTADRSGGSVTKTAIRMVGVGFNVTATASKSTVIAIDTMMYGTKVEATGASQTDSFTYNENSPSADTITRSSGDFTTVFEAGDTIIVSGTTSNDGEYTIDAVVALTITLISTDDLTQEGPVSSTIDGFLSFESIYQKDGPTDDDWFGIVSKNKDGAYEINYTLIIGDESGSSRTAFRSRGEIIFFADQPVGTNDLSIITKKDTGYTRFELGDSSGTSDDRVGFSGSIITQDNIFNGSDSYINLSVAIDICYIFGSTFLRITGGLDFSATSTHFITNCTFNGCGQVDLSQVEARNLTFSGYDIATDAALLWNGNIDIKNSSFLANTNSTSNATAIEHPAAGNFDYNNLKFSGNDKDIDFSAASGDLIINNTNGADASTYEITGGGSSVTIKTAVTLSVHVQDEATNDISDAQVYIQKTDPTTYTVDTGNTAGNGALIVNETVDTDTPQTGWVIVWVKSLNKIQPYRYASWTSKTFTFNTEVTGTADTGGSSITLKRKTGDSFLTADIEEGDTVRNTTDGSWAVVDEIIDADTITTSPLSGGSDNTWQENDGYSFHKLATTLTDNDDTVDIPIMNKQTDVNGDVSKAYSGSPTSINIRIRSTEGSTKYLLYNTSGSIGSGGYDLTAVLLEDEVA